MNSQEIHSFQFICSYRGTFSYQVRFKDNTTRRLEMRRWRDTRCEHSNFSPEEFEREVNGKIGLIDVKYFDGDTEALVVAFNRFCFLEYQAQVNQILANQQRYGHYTPDLFPVYVGGAYNLKERRWDVLHDFDQVRMKAGIPEDKCLNPRTNMAATQLSLVA